MNTNSEDDELLAALRHKHLEGELPPLLGIEITEKMIDAGIEIFSSQSGKTGERLLVENIYRAMFARRK